MGQWRERAAVKVNPEELFSVTCPCRKEGKAQTGSVPHHMMHLASTKWPKWTPKGRAVPLLGAGTAPAQSNTMVPMQVMEMNVFSHVFGRYMPENGRCKSKAASTDAYLHAPQSMHCLQHCFCHITAENGFFFSSFLADKTRLFYLLPVSVICIPKGWAVKLLEVLRGTPISGQQKGGAKRSLTLISTFKLSSAECSVLSCLQ